MAKANFVLIEALRNTAKTLATSESYQWGHMGSCNCGHLAQELTKLNKSEIHTRAMQKYGDWNEQLNDYCPTSGLLMDDLITELLSYGLDTDDLKHLEKLSDQRVLRMLPIGERHLIHNRRDDVVKYLEAWVNMLEESLVENIQVPVPRSQEKEPVEIA
ncbi:hypothetical protein FNH22_01710 [Fulvivirga sp. M361]|uniref:hypothetical protein n=1 Tax=Fulvivirga sp. M361 TaxID=2594266 RepID=UPI00117A60E1|nr:hypothetical protein [Fulvivirga sp. M361]TRX62061.1 hypothetical protein FNH22_01710 [Fulvivirga sp. M361]